LGHAGLEVDEPQVVGIRLFMSEEDFAFDQLGPLVQGALLGEKPFQGLFFNL
jgi:hypothetical protein